VDLENMILQGISKPTIPKREFLLTEFGTIADGKCDCTNAFERAVKAVSDFGGGRIIVPAGEYLTGPIHIKSNIELHLQKGATVRFIQDPDRYLPVVLTRFEGIELYNYSPFIYANGQQNIAITGEGLLDGQSDKEYWWYYKGKSEFGWHEGLPEQSSDVKELLRMAREHLPVENRIFGHGHYLRPNFIQFYNCKNVMIEGIKLIRSPMWCIHPVMCTDVIVREVTIQSQGPNNDGINPESCNYVLIENCHFDTGDDSIAIKSGKNEDGRRINVPSEYILIRNNVVHSQQSHGGVVIGSEMSGGVRNVVARQNLFINLERALRIKTNTARGGAIENIFFIDNVAVNVSREAVSIDLMYDNEAGDYQPIIRDIHIRGFRCVNAEHGILVRASENSKVEKITLEDSHFVCVKTPLDVGRIQQMVISKSTFNGLSMNHLVASGSLSWE